MLEMIKLTTIFGSRTVARMCLLTSLVLTALAPSVHADTMVPAVFGSGMVLQREQPLAVWGKDNPDSEVTVNIAGQEARAKTDSEGRWQVTLAALRAGGPHVMTVSGSSTLRFDDVLVGEVWLCSGQSNMEWPVHASLNPEMEIAAANHPRIRHLKLNHRTADKPLDDIETKGPWQTCSPATVGDFTGVGFFFARYLQKQLGVPVGLIGSNWGGTRIEPWTPPEGFKSVPALADIANALAEFPKKDDKGTIQHQSALAIYNSMIHPLVPYGIRGALWYQGESNNGEGMLYHEKMKALIQGWRQVWKRDDLPFYFVQLAPFRYGGDPLALAGMWEAQLETLSVPHTGMAVTHDIGNVADIHPRNKQEVGKRLALWALAKTYGQTGIVVSGPLYHSMRIEAGQIRLFFNHLGGGLVSRDGKALAHFTIASADQKFVEATAVIDGDSVVVSSPDVAQPVAVRLGWHQEAEPNLSNAAGLPASPFRTDKW
jgi:sialate O-acetylesterase